MTFVTFYLVPYIVGSGVGRGRDGCGIKVIRRSCILVGYYIFHGVACRKCRSRCVDQLDRISGIGHASLSRNLTHNLRNLVCYSLRRAVCNSIVEVVQCCVHGLCRCSRFDGCKSGVLGVRHSLLVSSDIIVCVDCIDRCLSVRLCVVECLLRLGLDRVHCGFRIRLRRINAVNRGCAVDSSLAVCDRLSQCSPVGFVIVILVLSALQCIEVGFRGGLRICQLIANRNCHRFAGVVRIITLQSNLHIARIQAGNGRAGDGFP